MKNILKCVKFVLPIAPIQMVIFFLISLPSVILPVVLLSLERQLVDSASKLTKQSEISSVIYLIILLILVYTIMKLFAIFSRQYMEFGYFWRVILALDARIHRKMGQLPLEYYDSAKTFQIIEGGKNASMFIVFTANLANLSVLLVFTLVSVSTYLVNLNIILIPFIVMVTAPVVLEKYKVAKEQALLQKANVQFKREMDYFGGLLKTPENVKEIKINGSGSFFFDKYTKALIESINHEKLTYSRIFGMSISIGFFKTICHGLAIAIITYLFITKQFTVGEFSVALSSFVVLTDSYNKLFAFTGEVMQTGILSQPFFTMLELPEALGGLCLENDGDEVLRFENVSYQYPGTTKPVLHDLTFTLKRGEMLAVVGVNGAGKSTIAKLMSGFLQPTSGCIYYGKQDRELLSERSILNQISATFQNYGRYKLSIGDNIYISDTKGTIDTERVIDALCWVNLESIAGKDPFNTMLGREFGGQELSGGQWQRLAIARCKYREREIIFFDEPTAAIDPLEEVQIFNKLHEMTYDKTIILITHRLGAVKKADQIIVVDEGRIIQKGTFNELVIKDGLFSVIWNEQLKWYDKEMNDIQ